MQHWAPVGFNQCIFLLLKILVLLNWKAQLDRSDLAPQEGQQTWLNWLRRGVGTDREQLVLLILALVESSSVLPKNRIVFLPFPSELPLQMWHFSVCMCEGTQALSGAVVSSALQFLLHLTGSASQCPSVQTSSGLVLFAFTALSKVKIDEETLCFSCNPKDFTCLPESWPF